MATRIARRASRQTNLSKKRRQIWIYSDILAKKHKNKLIAIVGDSNIDLLQHNTYEPATKLFDTYTEYGFAPVISRPTRVTTTSATLIDHIFVSTPHRVSNSAVLTLDMSDHLATHVTLLFSDKDNHQHTNSTTANPQFATMNLENLDKFREKIYHTDWTTINVHNTVNEKFSAI